VSPPSTLRALRDAIARRERSCREVVAAHLDRIEEHNGRLGALCHVDAEAALEAAADLDARIANGIPVGPLAGIPVSVKDAFSVRGMPARAGMPSEPSSPRPEDAPAVARLRALGAVVVGKSAVPEGLRGIATESPVAAPTRHPRDRSRVVGGSSGGSAVAVATGMAAFDLASDLHGSIRVPASFVGVAGLRLTPGVLSKRLHLPWPYTARIEPPESAPGFVGQSARDLADILGALRGSVIEARAPRRLGIVRPDRRATDHAVAAGIEAAWEALDVPLVEVEPPGGIERLLKVGWALARAEIAFASPDASTLDVGSYLRLLDERAALAAWWDELDLDGLLVPAAPCVAPRRADLPAIWVDGTKLDQERAFDWAVVTSALRMPSVTLPVGDEGGLPFAMQLAARSGDDEGAVTLALWAEEVLAFSPDTRP